jgi:predicted transcriptional regulator
MEKERFVIEQTEKLKEMNDSYLTMIDYAKVLKCVSVIIPRIQAGQDVMASMHGGLIN